MYALVIIIYTNNVHCLQADGLPRASLMCDLMQFATAYNRGSVVNWMVGAAFSIGMSNAALFHGVQLLDRSGIAISCKKLLPAMAALWLAAKYENGCYPRSSLILQLSHTQSYSKAELHQQEVTILNAVGYRLSLPTINTFLCFYMSQMLHCKKLYFCTSYLAELCLLDTLILSYLPSKVAASVYVWGMALCSKCCTMKDLMRVSGYKMCVIKPIIRRIAYLHQAASRSDKPCIISMKYLDHEFGSVAMITPLTDIEIETVIIGMEG